jgi:thiamine biosynthesis protein ThiI
VERRSGRLAVYPEKHTERVAKRLQDVFGIKSVSPAWGVPTQAEAVVDRARAVLFDALEDYPPGAEITFRVRTRRADKRFPMTSTDFDRHVADNVLEGLDQIRVQLRAPELELGIELRCERAYVFVRRLPGPGGLPVGTLGRALCLLSGGIDSPVAAYMAMKRGLRVSFVSFHSYPYIGEASKKKVADLARSLARFQPRSRLYSVPFAEIQTAVRDSAPEGYRTVLYRRMMQRIASKLARRFGLNILVTGESLGQVASQTLENMACIGAAADIPVMQPLISFDKEETMDVARRIGTLEISNQPQPDCCTVFMPRKPVIRGRLEDCLAAEAEMEVDALISRALEGVEIIAIE